MAEKRNEKQRHLPLNFDLSQHSSQVNLVTELFPSSSMLCPWLCITCSNGTPDAWDVSPPTAPIFLAPFEGPWSPLAKGCFWSFFHFHLARVEFLLRTKCISSRFVICGRMAPHHWPAGVQSFCNPVLGMAGMPLGVCSNSITMYGAVY